MGTELISEALKALNMLLDEGFTSGEAAAVLRAAKRNRFDPVAYAKRAIRLREHVREGARL
jgi:hypothetical protein